MTKQAEYWLIVAKDGYPICAGNTPSEAWRTLGMIEGWGAVRAVYAGAMELPAVLRCVRVRVVDDPA